MRRSRWLSTISYDCTEPYRLRSRSRTGASHTIVTRTTLSQSECSLTSTLCNTSQPRIVAGTNSLDRGLGKRPTLSSWSASRPRFEQSRGPYSLGFRPEGKTRPQLSDRPPSLQKLHHRSQI